MSQPDAIIFDLGNVLLTLDWDRPARRLSACTGLTRQQLEEYYARTPWTNRLAVGALSKEEFFAIVAPELGFHGSYAEFAELWSDMFTPNAPMISLARSLKGRIPRLILSNTNAIHMEFVFSRYPFMDEFDGYVFSHEIGVAKPDARIYEWTLRRHRLAAARTVFIDDVSENVIGAQAVGLPAIHYQSAAQACRELTNLGLATI